MNTKDVKIRCKYLRKEQSNKNKTAMSYIIYTIHKECNKKKNNYISRKMQYLFLEI